jgi:hypothetical protein
LVTTGQQLSQQGGADKTSGANECDFHKNSCEEMNKNKMYLVS